MEMKRCDLCEDAAATMYCESDSARLCLLCDEKVHGANFLVAKHERSLLCSVCQMVTSWKASGPRLGRTISICDGCVSDRNSNDFDRKEEEVAEEVVESRDRSYGSSDDEDDAEDEDDDEDDEEEDDEDEDEGNQVVPWSSVEKLSSSGICGGERGRDLKRRRDVSDEEVENGGGSSSGDGDRSRTASRLIKLNRFSNQTDHVRAGNLTTRISTVE